MSRTVWVEYEGQKIPVAEIARSGGRWTAAMSWWRTARTADTEEEIVEIAKGWLPPQVGAPEVEYMIHLHHGKHDDLDPDCPRCVDDLED